MKKNKFNDYIKKIKELWAYPRYRAIIKLSLYGIMFLILIIMANLYNETNNEDAKYHKSFTEILNSTNVNNTEIEYNIKVKGIEYKIDGKIENSILTGYLENNNNIKKIKLENNIIYNIGNNNEIVDNELNNILITDFLLPEKIIDITSNLSAYIEKTNSNTNYIYQITYNNIQYEIKLTSNLEVFSQITIKNSDIEYNLNIIFDKIN